jgi:tRNA(fMet)-specific endonuclease VapC
MIAFDADVLTEILAGNARYITLASRIPAHEQSVPIIVVEEIFRGRLNSIRQAEGGRSKLSICRAYQLFDQTIATFRDVITLAYTPAADDFFQQWRNSRIKGGTHDLRIAAICVAHQATLVTRNRRDFEGLPGLLLDVWH